MLRNELVLRHMTYRPRFDAARKALCITCIGANKITYTATLMHKFNSSRFLIIYSNLGKLKTRLSSISKMHCFFPEISDDVSEDYWKFYPVRLVF